jgi:hypothetical protein
VRDVIRKAAPKDRLTDRDFDNLAACDSVVQCFGDCDTSTSISVADAVEIERRGIPTVTVFAFADAARNQAAGRGIADLPGHSSRGLQNRKSTCSPGQERHSQHPSADWS